MDSKVEIVPSLKRALEEDPTLVLCMPSLKSAREEDSARRTRRAPRSPKSAQDKFMDKLLPIEEIERRVKMCKFYRPEENTIYRFPAEIEDSFMYNLAGHEIRRTNIGETFTKVGSFPTQHTYAYVALFKPSIEEIMTGLPAGLFGEVAGWNERYLISIDFSHSDDHFHYAITTVWIDNRN